MGSLAVGAGGQPSAASGSRNEDASCRVSSNANRVGRPGATAVDDYPLETLVYYWFLTQQGRPTRARPVSLSALAAEPLSTSEGPYWVVPPLSPPSRAALSSISSLDLPFFTNQYGDSIPRIGSSRHSTHDNNTLSTPNTNTTDAAAVEDAPLFYTFFRSSSASSLGSSFDSTTDGYELEAGSEPDPPDPDDWDLDSLDSRRDSNSNSNSNSNRHSNTDSDSDATMPGPMLQAVPLDASAIPPSSSAYFASPSFDSAASSTTSYRRPQSAKSARSARSQSPLFARWRRHHPPMPVDARDVAHANASGNNNNYRVGKKHAKDGELTRTTSINKRPFGAPQLTREEFEALPLAIQRKYFSTLERLRFAQESNGVDGISQHYNDISAQNAKRRKARQHRSSSENLGGRLRRRSLRDAHLPSPDRYPVTELPEKIKRSHFSREDQVFLARQLRASVILDAADEAIYKIGRRASKHLAPDVELLSPIVSSRRNSMESEKRAAPEPGPDSFYDSFRWLDDEEDLDLRLFLDDYHANLREEVPSPTKERRPSFRRHLSISKIPFGRSSVSSSRPATKDAASPSPVSPSQSPVVNSSGSFNHGRRKSRALSLITPKHGAHDSLSAFDPAAAHYQDPEARLKLRVYLASPQKFDEAIEFGFPSMDALSASPVITKDSRAALHKRQSRQKLSDDPSMRTFLADDDDDDDKASLNSDQPSLADPESPKTPQYFENKPSARPMRVSSENHASKPSDGGYAQVPASSREMTLRMTLTRPDLRANEDQIYGWQAKGGQPRRKSLNVSAGLDAHAVTYIGDSQHKESIEKVFAGIDHWNANQPPDGSVMKRIWNRVRRS